ADWRAELREALEMADGHLSLYQLTIEPGTRFGDLAARGRLRGLPEDGLAADLYALTQDLCGAAGLPAYEISNHARPGAECRHNLVYWRSGDWIGIGPGAHGRVTRGAERWATERLRDPKAWLAAVEARGEGLAASVPVGAAERAEEYLMMALRLAEGAELGRFQALGGNRPASAIAQLREAGFLWQRDGRIGTTAQGRPVLNAILAELLA
ncbi:MAG TPA: coproporphyrinogen III oxidase, partial [Paracoccaceae bacterium]|nr:coproporphyrinogen III oxidase [Paracoccaceae bacterium]